MSSLHPFDEVDVRKGSNLATLTAKQIEAAQLQAELNKWLAQGNQIGQAVGHCGKAAPFNSGKVLNEQAAKNSGWKKIEFEQHPKVSRLFERGENHRANILEFMRQANRPVRAVEIAQHMGMQSDAAQWHVRALHGRNMIKVTGKVGNARLYAAVGDSQMSKTSQRRASKPKQPKLVVKRMWFKIEDIADPNVDFYEASYGDLEADGKTCLAKEYWRVNLRGWWSFTLTFHGYDDDNQLGERSVNFRPEVMLSPKEVIKRVRENFDSFVEANEDFNSVGSVAMITISNRKPVSVYGGES